MTNEEIEELKEEANIEVLQDVDGNIIDLDTNQEFKDMGKGEEE